MIGKIIAGVLVLSLLLVPGLLPATDQKRDLQIGSKFTYVQTMGDQTMESVRTIQKSERINGHWCWKVEAISQDTVSYTWSDKDTLGIWKISQEIYGIAMASTWGPEPANEILPIGDRSYDTKMSVEIGGKPIGEMIVAYKITDKGTETVVVPAGRFEANHLVIEQTTTIEGDQPTTVTTEIWYSAKVGNMVKETQDLMGTMITTELKSYKL